MGAVWRAHDERLGRTVAIKVSKGEFTDRFEREARAVAALNHPHICQLYDIGPDYLVMEFIEGAPLKGPLPMGQAIEYARQILDALDAAHRKGFVHRDLKPANILVTKQGIKLLDFGLVKQTGIGLKDSDATLTQALTQAGQIAGTLQYMSPEQLQGIEADPRSDLFAFGLVFYEMLTGTAAFQAKSSASLIAAVLKDEPRPVHELQPGIPARLEQVLAGCLAKDPDERWQNARDLRRELGFVQTATAVSPVNAPGRKRRVWPVAAAVALIALASGFGAARWLASTPSDAAEILPLTTLAGIEDSPSLSPDGKLVAFTWTGANFGNTKICVKQLDAGDPLILSHSDRQHGSPAWSPDGRQIAYLRAGDQGVELMMVSALGGAERTVGQPWRGDLVGGMAWLPVANQLVASGGALTALAPDGSARKAWTKPPQGHQDLYPSLSPDGHTIAFLRRGAWIAAAPGEILLLALNSRQEPAGEPTSLASGLLGVNSIAWAPDGRSLIVSALNKDNGRLFRVAVPGGKTELVGGVAAGIAGGGISISAVAHRLAMAQAETDIDIERVAGPAWPAGEKRPEPEALIASTRDDVSPSWSADGKKIVFESNRSGSQEIWSVSANGQDAVQLTSFGGPPVGSPRYSPDGSKVAFDSRKFGNADIFVVGASGGQATRLTTGPASHTLPAWSADGNWIYYSSDATGRWEIWKSEAAGGPAVQVSHDGGHGPQHAFGDKWIYWWWGGLWRIPDSGGAVEKIDGDVDDADWTAWRDGLAAHVASTRVAFMKWSDHKITYLPDLPKPTSPRYPRRSTIAVSPDGKWLLYTTTVLDRGDLMLVENFH
jgi:serine/threonine protein kinase